MLTKMNYGMRNSDTYIMKSLLLKKCKDILKFDYHMVNRPAILAIILMFSLILGVGNVWGQYYVDFEGVGETKTSYTSGNVTLSGTQWNMTEALIGTDAADYKNGVRSARMRGYSSSSITMNSNKSNGLGSISFKYWRYGTDAQATWKVEYSTNDGSSWTQAGTNFTPPTNNNEQTFSATSINVTGNVRIRITHVSGGNTSTNRRFNIDDITLTDYVASPTITLADNGNQVGTSSVAAGTANVILHQSSLAVTTANATLTGVSFTTAGTYAASDVSNFKVWYSADNSFATTGDNIQLGSTITTSLGPGSKSISSLSQTINPGSTGYIFITADIAASTTAGNTININALTTSDVTFSSGTKSGSTTAGGTITFQAATSPTLNAITLSSALSSTYGIASTGVSFIASGLNLTGNITATAQTGYQVSTDNNSFGSSVSVTSGTTIYVRFASTLVAGTYNSATAVVLSGGGASSDANVTTSSSGNTVSKATPNISSAPTASSITYGQTLASSILSGGSASVAGTFAFTSPSNTPNAGTTNQSITFTPTDNTNYNTTTTNVSITVNKANQTITFSALTNKTTADAPFALTATSSSNLAVSYTSSNAAVATVSGSTVTIIGAGQTTITASQLGDANYNAATDVANVLTVTSAPVVIAIQDFETSPATPTWGYTGGGNFDNTASRFNGLRSYQLPTSASMTTDNLDISNYSNVSVSVAYAATGVDTGEDLFIEVSYDNGSTWNGTGSTQLVDGSSNAAVNINSLNGLRTPTGANPYTFNVSANETQIRLRFTQTGTTNTSLSEFFWIDDVKVIGTLNTSPTIIRTPTSLNGFSQTSSSPSSEQSYTVSGNNLTGNVTITPPTGYEISTNSGVSFSATNPITLSVSGGDIVGEPVTIYVRQNSSTLGAVSGNISHTSTGANNPNVAVSGTRTGTYYSKSTGNLDDLTTWGLNTDGTGTAPANFTTDGVIFEIRNRATATIGANWTVSGTASKVVIGDGTNAVDFTIPSGFSLTGTIDVSDNAELTIENTTAPTFGTFATNSTLEYNNVAVTLSTSTTYRNLKLSGSGTKTFPGGTITVAGNLTLDGCTYTGASSLPFSTLLLGGNLNYIGTVTPPADANSITLTTNGTVSGTQTITGAGNTVRWFRIQTTTANTILLSSVGGSSNILLGNNSGGGITLVDGSILNMNGNDFTLFNNISTTNAFLFNSTGSISTNTLTDFIIERSGNGNLGTLRFTSGTNTIGNLTLNHSGSTNNTVVIGNTLNIAGTLTLTAGVFDANNVTTLNSTSSLIYNGGSMINYTIPTSLNNFTLPTGTTALSNDISLSGNLNLGSNTLDIGSNTLTINGDITRTTGSIKTNGGKLILEGTSSSTLHFDQTTDGTTNKLKDLTINRTGATVTLGNKLQIAHNGTVTVTAGTLAASGNLVLTSTLGGTARIAELAAGAAVSGNVEIQRYMVGGASSQRGWRYMSSPVASSTYAQLIDDIFITGPGGASNGFDWTGNSSSVMTYEESSSRGWKNITSPSNTWNPGKGAIVFFRGDRTQTSSITNTNVAPNSFALDYSGNINSGSFTINLDYDNTTGVAANQGWNLIGNPYPSQIDWDLVTKTSGVNSHYYLINPTSKNYLSANTGIIAIGQGFFVQVNASGQSVSFEENDKTSSNGTAYFKTATNPITIKMHLDSVQNDVAKIFFVTGASKNYLFTEDAIKLNNAVYNLSIVTPNNIDVQNSYVPHLGNTGTDTFELKVTSTTNTSYYLSFDNFAQIPSGKAILLLDKQNNSITNLRLNGNYQFAINNSQSSSFGNRFLLIITDQHNSLPLKLTQFSGASKGLTNELTWVTVSEKNIIGFEVQKSDDGFDFETIGFVKANNQQSTSKYLYTDNQSKNTKVYYRLKINERNLVNFSHVVVLNNELQQNHVNQLQVFPNPAQNSLSINLIDNNNIGKIYVFDLFGKLMQQHDGVSQIDVSKLSSGSYIIQVEVNDITYRVKFTKN